MTIPINVTTKVLPNTKGRDFNFYQKKAVTNTTFGTSADGYAADMVITFSTQSVMFLNEGTTSTQVVEYSFNGNTVHGELDPSLPSRTFMFENRVIGAIWFRLKAGSSGPVNVRVDAWSIR
jgi:hypothetical protein